MLDNKIVLTAIVMLLGISCATSQGWNDQGSDWNNGNNGGSGNNGGDWSNGNNDGNGNNGGNGGTNTVAQEGDKDVYYSQITEDSGTLIDESTSNQYPQAHQVQYMMVGGSKNSFWVTSRDGSQNWKSIDIPQYRYARLLILPAESGRLVLEEMYPNGRTRTYDMGYVNAGRQYRVWFYSDTSGTHQGRYQVNGDYSQTLTFNVY